MNLDKMRERAANAIACSFDGKTKHFVPVEAPTLIALIDAAKALEAAQADQKRLRRGLDFYARGCHFSHDGNVWETVSGEPPNYWCDEQGTTVEDGGVAKAFLDGWDFDPDPDAEGMIPPSAAIATLDKAEDAT